VADYRDCTGCVSLQRCLDRCGARRNGSASEEPWIVSLFSTGNLLLIGGPSLSCTLATLDPAPATPEPDPAREASDAEIMACLEALMKTGPVSTLDWLAHRLCLLAKQLSAGYQTKSSLSREFFRLTGRMPSAWSKWD